ncbi:MAG: hydrogenase expression/formation protein HypE [Bacteroidetes bacterium]|jgi:hydrogenase expression/formation protein HypE|nr:hydrogenase expression/formation protein HypE [Bacteroidota bacterium]
MTLARVQPDFDGAACPIPLTDYPHVLLAHGGGGTLSQHLIDKIFLPAFANEALGSLHDGATLPVERGVLAVSTDSFVIDPIFFPGGDIGSLAVHGTVNDVAMCGARPFAITAGFILEEGLPMDDLWKIAQSMGEAARAAGVRVVTGDTKVVDRGKGDKIYINTTGLGIVPQGVRIDPARATPGDVILLSGPIASHGVAILSVREGLAFETQVTSDSIALHGMVAGMLDAFPDIHVLRDPTRGGVASALNEIARSSRRGMRLDQSALPIAEEVQGACEILGLDPLYVANEGVLIAIVPPEAEGPVLSAMQAHPAGRHARRIGAVVADHPGTVVMRTTIGGTRVVDMLSGEQLPRIC